MAYTLKVMLGGLKDEHAVDLTAAAVHGKTLLPQDKMLINRIQMHVTTATVSTGNIVVAFKKYLAPGVSAGAVTLGSITIPTAIAAGKVYYKDISSVGLEPGQEIVVEVTTAAAGGGAAGAAVFALVGEEDPEVPANMSNMVASA